MGFFDQMGAGAGAAAPAGGPQLPLSAMIQSMMANGGGTPGDQQMMQALIPQLTMNPAQGNTPMPSGQVPQQPGQAASSSGIPNIPGLGSLAGALTGGKGAGAAGTAAGALGAAAI